jgi:hypothetical protein
MSGNAITDTTGPIILNASNGLAFGANNVNVGTAGQVLTSGGPSAVPSWTTPTSTTPNLATVMAQGAKASTILDMSGNAITDTTGPIILNASNGLAFGANNVNVGTAGQVLTSNSSGQPTWEAIGSTMIYNWTFSVTNQSSYTIHAGTLEPGNYSVSGQINLTDISFTSIIASIIIDPSFNIALNPHTSSSFSQSPHSNDRITLPFMSCFKQDISQAIALSVNITNSSPSNSLLACIQVYKIDKFVVP